MTAAERQLFSERKIRLARWFKKLIRPLGKVFWETQSTLTFNIIFTK